MKKNCFLLLIATFFFACGNNERSQIDISEIPLEQRDSVRNIYKEKLDETYAFQLEDFKLIEESDYLFFPVKIANGDSEYSGSRMSSMRLNAYKDGGFSQCWNILFYNTQNKNYHSLLQDTVAIVAHYFQFASSPPDTIVNADNKVSIFSKSDYKYEGEYAFKYLFYQIRFDHNQDGKLNFKDPSQLYITDKTGNNLMPLTPSNTDLVNWEFYKKSNLIIAKTRIDSNGDNQFDQSDTGNNVFEIDLENPKMGTPIFAEKFVEDLKGMMLEKHFLRE